MVELGSRSAEETRCGGGIEGGGSGVGATGSYYWWKRVLFLRGGGC